MKNPPEASLSNAMPQSVLFDLYPTERAGHAGRRTGALRRQLAPAPEKASWGDLEGYFERFRRHIIGSDQTFETLHGRQHLVYADWTASGRLYAPIEERISRDIGAFVGNTHTKACATGNRMTLAYEQAKTIIKEHVNASAGDVIITAGSGTTRVLGKLQRILGLKVPSQLRRFITIPPDERPVVFVSHMEHHSNHTSWLETIADVVCIQPDERGLLSPAILRQAIARYSERPMKIGAFTACSNVSGICTPVHDLAEVMHEYGGYCFVDFAASAPYVRMDMHPGDPQRKLDAIYFSPHKFLGGPGSAGVLIFDASLYRSEVPDQPGGGTVDWTNPWGGRKYVDDIEAREDGGTPGFLQTIKAALAIRLKEMMTVEMIAAREKELLDVVFEELPRIPGMHVLAGDMRERLGIVSFYVENVHYNLFVRLLNDLYGIQMRGGCSCAGTYGHYLLGVDRERSRRITEQLDRGDMSEKPGWVRLSLHPTMTDDDLDYILGAIREVATNHDRWGRQYRYCSASNEFYPAGSKDCDEEHVVRDWLTLTT
jgi:selenocysteine lyase/cysteine desulfurase